MTCQEVALIMVILGNSEQPVTFLSLCDLVLYIARLHQIVISDNNMTNTTLSFQDDVNTDDNSDR